MGEQLGEEPAEAPLNCWSIEQVASWLARLGLPTEVQENFKRNAVDGGADGG